MTPQPSAATEQDNIILRMDGVGKKYGNFVALTDVSFAIRRGAIHGLLGENGAGKSTLVGIISGQKLATEGSIYLNGQVIGAADVQEMEDNGVFLVTQEPMIIDHISAAENLMLGIWPNTRGFIRWRQLRSDAQRMLAGTGIDPSAVAGSLDAVARRKLNILRAMFSGGKLIILDEPTAALTVEDRRKLFDFMRRLKTEGVTFIFISHYNDEILDICDSVTVLRDGRLAGGSDDVASMTSEQLSELVLGRGLKLFQRKRRNFDNEPPAIKLEGIRAEGLSVDRLHIHSGEIIGFTGLPGAGAKELARCIFGLMPAKGIVIINGNAIDVPKTPKEAFAKGIGFLSDDRRKDGSVAQMSIGQNISLSSLKAVSKSGFLSGVAEQSLAERYFNAMAIKAAGYGTVVDTLSGGNQQKVCLGRVMATQPTLLILDEPTRGIDVGVKQDVLRIIDELTHQGVCVIIVSTDTDELVRATDRVCVFSGGGISSVLSGQEIETERLRKVMGAG